MFRGRLRALRSRREPPADQRAEAAPRRRPRTTRRARPTARSAATRGAAPPSATGQVALRARSDCTTRCRKTAQPVVLLPTASPRRLGSGIPRDGDELVALVATLLGLLQHGSDAAHIQLVVDRAGLERSRFLGEERVL